ncbi:M14 family zinc carboxypeptidase [Dokdonia ponticola]|uniref:M14 family zinc carboxypeptidase n=1 Tax=Dokdonia ponticola TaxID=2041041 RepID=A0ABV9HSH7_9FLAO
MKKTTLRRTALACALSLCAFTGLFAQDVNTSEIGTAKRILLTAPSMDQLHTIQDAGLDLHCGAKFEGDDLRLDLQFPEVQILDELGVSYQVIEDNLTQFYVDRYESTREEGEAFLREIKERSLAERAHRASLSTGDTTIESFIQREECQEIDWVSQNFRLGGFLDPSGTPFGGCLTVDEMIIELDRMRTLYPNLISMRQDASPTGQQTNGNTTGPTSADFDPQTIWYVRISDNPDMDELNEPETLITGMTHAREVNSMMNVIYYMWWVLENYELDPTIKNMVDNQELYFIPVVNPDGVKWNEVIAPQGGGLQRKNLRPGVNDTGSTTCTNPNNQSACNALRGVDLNRNSSYYWGFDNSGSSPTQSSDVYRGPFPASEPETQILADFIETREFKYAINHHSGINSIVTSSYNGNPNAAPSNREDEYQKLMHDATRFNRYIHGSAPNTLTAANGDTNDYMLGGPDVTYTTFIDADGDNQGSAGSNQSYTSSGSGKNIITFSPENGDDFWPTTTDIIKISKRAVRMNLLTCLYAGKYARLHDFTTTNVTSTTPQIDFEVEYLGQTASDLTLTVTPISSNITGVTQPTVGALNGMNILEQRATSATLTLDAGIAANDPIEYQVTLSNDTYIIYQVNYIKYYTPSIAVNADGFSNWTASGTANTWAGTTDGYNGSTNAITSTPSPPYGNNVLSFVTLDTPVDLSTANSAVVHFNAKWDIERNFDLAQFEASIDGGSTWIALCGKYTKVPSGEQGNFHLNKSSANQIHQETNGTLIYDGDLVLDPNVVNTATAADDVDKWVLEEFLLDATNNDGIVGNSNVLFRFRFDTDSTNRADGYDTNFEGFTFDNFQISTLDQTDRCVGEVVNVFPNTQDFEGVLGYFMQSNADDGDWLLDTGGTPTGGTGPTAGTNGDTYLYIEASAPGTTAGGINQGNTAILNSSCIDLSASSSASLDFDYHMQITGGFTTVPTLNVQVSQDNGNSWVNATAEISGTASSAWMSRSVDLSTYTGGIIRIRFVGMTGVGSFQGDIAIDNVVLNASTTDYIFDAGSWTPADPSGIAKNVDNIQVLSGAPILTADTDINNISIDAGATLGLGTTSIELSGDITNLGTLDADQAEIIAFKKDGTDQSLSGNTFEVARLTINNSAAISVDTGVRINELLTLTDGELITNNNLTLASNATQSAMIDQVVAGSITGNVTIERFVPARRAFRFVTSPVTTTTTIRENWQENGATTAGFGTHITGSTTGANGFDTTPSGNPSLFTYDNSAATPALTPIDNTDVNTLTAGDAYLLFVRGDRTIDVTSNSATPTDTRLRATGTIVTGTTTITGADINHNAGNFNLIGNPYQATVEMNTILGDATNLNTNQYYVWDATLGARGAYVTVLLDGTGSTNGAGSDANHFLQPWQSAFVTTASTVGDNSTSVSFRESDKTVGEDTMIFLTENDPIANNAHIVGQLFRTEAFNAGEKLQDNFVLLFSPTFSNQITLEDAQKFFNIDENMAISNGDNTLSVERRAMPTTTDEISLFNNTYRTDAYTLRIEQSGLEEVTAYLEDTFTGEFHELEDGENFIAFTVDTANEASSASNRFKIVFEESALNVDEAFIDDVTMFPNPVEGDQLLITSSVLRGQDVTLKINNLLGQSIYNQERSFNGDTLEVSSLSTLSNGIYFVTITTTSGSITKRLIKK